MCKASKYMSEMQSFTKRVSNDLDKLRKLNSMYDKQINEIYHRIEVSTFNKSQGDAMCRKLQIALRKRRVCKHELEKMQKLYDGLDVKNAIDKLSKTHKRVTQTDNGNKEYTNGWNISIADLEQELIAQ